MNIASVVISGDSFTTRIRKPLMRPFRAATPSAAPRPSAKVRRAVVSPSAKNDRITTTSPVSGPTDRSMPPVISTKSCPTLTKASALASSSVPPRLRSLRNLELTPAV